MKKLLFLSFAALATCAVASAGTIIPCTVNPSGGVGGTTVGVGGVIAGTLYANVTSNSSTGIQSAYNMFSCPGIAAVGASTTLNNVTLNGSFDYSLGSSANTVNGSFCTGGACGPFTTGLPTNVTVTGGISSGSSVPPSPFQIGNAIATLGVNGSVAAFSVSVSSAVSSGGPVSNSSAQVWLMYDTVTSGVPEPATSALLPRPSRTTPWS